MRQELETLPAGRGALVVRAHVSGVDGHVAELEWLTDTVVAPGELATPTHPGDDSTMGVRDLIQGAVVQHLRDAKFPTSADGTFGNSATCGCGGCAS